MNRWSAWVVAGALASSACNVGRVAPGHEFGGGYVAPQARLPFGDMAIGPEATPPLFPGLAGDTPSVGPMLGIDFSRLSPPAGVIAFDAEGSNLAQFQTDVRARTREGMSLIDVDTGEVVPTIVQEQGRTFIDSVPVSGQSLSPVEPLPAGWYLFRADLTAVRALGLPFEIRNAAHEGDVAYARFHVGPERVWVATLVDCASPTLRGEEGCDIAAVAGDGAEVPTEFAVRYDAVDIACEPRPIPGLATMPYLCPLPARGTTIGIRAVGGLLPPSGASDFEHIIDANRVLDDTRGAPILETEPEFAMDLVRRAP